jgi:hypothetical protein
MFLSDAEMEEIDRENPTREEGEPAAWAPHVRPKGKRDRSDHFRGLSSVVVAADAPIDFSRRPRR